MHKSWLVLADKILTGRCIDDFTFNNILLFYHVIQRVSMLLWVCTVIDHRRCENVGKTSVMYLAAPCVKFLFLPHFEVFCYLLLNPAWQHGIYLLINPLTPGSNL